MQITKIISPLFDNERHQLYLSDGELGIVAKLSKEFSSRVLGGSLKQFDVILATKTSGHILSKDLVIVSVFSDMQIHKYANMTLYIYCAGPALMPKECATQGEESSGMPDFSTKCDCQEKSWWI